MRVEEKTRQQLLDELEELKQSEQRFRNLTENR